MLNDSPEKMRRPIFQGLLAVAVLGVVTSGLAVVALHRAVTASTSLRLTHARESTAEELARLGTAAPDSDAPAPNIIGMRGDIARVPGEIAGRVPPPWGPSLVALGQRALATGGAVYDEIPITGARLVERAAPAPGGRVAWVALKVGPSPYLQSWRVIVGALTISAMLLVLICLASLVSFKRGASQLMSATRALSRDLTAPVPRPPVARARRHRRRHRGAGAQPRRVAAGAGAPRARARAAASAWPRSAASSPASPTRCATRSRRSSCALDLAASPAGDAPPLPAAVAGAIAHASAEIARLDRLVADLLIVAGRALGPAGPVDVGAARPAAAPTPSRPGPRCAGVTMHVADAAPGAAVATVDADAVARAVDNLLRNAVEASPGGDVVEVEVARRRRAGPRVRVVDRGAGVAAGRDRRAVRALLHDQVRRARASASRSRAPSRRRTAATLAYAREGALTRFELTLPREARGGAAAAAGGARA